MTSAQFEGHIKQAVRLGRQSSEARRDGDETLASENERLITKIAALYERNDARTIRSAYYDAYRAASTERSQLWDAGRW